MDERTRNQLKFLINIAYLLVIALLVYGLVKYVSGWVLPFIIAFLLVSILNPLIKKINRILNVKHEILAFAMMLIVYGGVGYLLAILGIKLVSMLKEVFTYLPGYYENVINPAIVRASQVLSDFQLPIPVENINFADYSGEILGAIQSFISNISQWGISFVAGFTGKIPEFFMALIFTVMLSFFIGMQYDTVLRFIKKQLSPKGLEIISHLKVIFFDTVGNYLKAYLKLMTITFIELSIGFTVLGVASPIAIALTISIFDALPVLGTGGVMIPWILIELLQGNFSFALGLGAVYGFVTVVRNIIEPKIIGDQLGLNPIVSLIVIYLGFRLFGILGMIAMPMTAQILIALQKKGVIKIYNPL